MEDKSGVPNGNDQERPESERWRYESNDGRATFEGRHAGARLWSDDGVKCWVELLELSDADSRVNLSMGVRRDDESADATASLKLSAEQAEHLAEDLLEHAAYLRRVDEE